MIMNYKDYELSLRSSIKALFPRNQVISTDSSGYIGDFVVVFPNKYDLIVEAKYKDAGLQFSDLPPLLFIKESVERSQTNRFTFFVIITNKAAPSVIEAASRYGIDIVLYNSNSPNFPQEMRKLINKYDLTINNTDPNKTSKAELKGLLMGSRNTIDFYNSTVIPQLRDNKIFVYIPHEFKTSIYLEDLKNRIPNFDFIILDISSQTPSLMLEAGMAISIGKKIIVTKDMAEKSHLVLEQDTIEYSKTAEGANILFKRIMNYLRRV